MNIEHYDYVHCCYYEQTRSEPEVHMPSGPSTILSLIFSGLTHDVAIRKKGMIDSRYLFMQNNFNPDIKQVLKPSSIISSCCGCICYIKS